MNWLRRFRKPPVTPDISTVTAKPGKTTIRVVDDSGRPVAILVLAELRNSREEGWSATFVDMTHFMAHRRGQW